MRVNYTTHERVSWRYVCVGNAETRRSVCWSVNGKAIDEAVEELFLSTMVPEEIDLTMAVEREASSQAGSLEGQWQARLEQARYEAKRAERRYKAVDPDNRVVARTLEREWEVRLQDLDDVERQHAEARRACRVDLGDRDRAALREIARDLPAVWRAPTTSAADRKTMLRLVVEMITLEPVEIPVHSTRVRVQWCSGTVDERTIERRANPAASPCPTDVTDRIRRMLDQGLSNAQIAQRLNADGLATARLNRWSPWSVAHIRQNHNLRRAQPYRVAFLPDRHPENGRYSVSGAARRFGVTTNQVQLWVRRGLVAVHRERYGRYDNVWWLDIDDASTAELDRLAHQQEAK